MSKNTISCSLCKASNIEHYCSVPEYKASEQLVDCYLCKTCFLIFKDPSRYFDIHREKHRYDQHNNDISNLQYLDYLKLLWSDRPKQHYISVLDFGCGPTKGLEALAKDFNIQSYDPIYFPIELKQSSYDLIYASEVVEHFYDANRSWKELTNLLSPGGFLLVRTEPYPEKQKFLKWYYKDDPTHVCFYNNPKSFQWIEDSLSLSLKKVSGSNRFVFKKL